MPIYTIFGGGGEGSAPKKHNFFCQNFPKLPKNGFFDLFFFQNIACGAEILAKTESFYCFRRARKINLADLNKGRQNFRKFFENPPLRFQNPPLVYPIIWEKQITRFLFIFNRRTCIHFLPFWLTRPKYIIFEAPPPNSIRKSWVRHFQNTQTIQNKEKVPFGSLSGKKHVRNRPCCWSDDVFQTNKRQKEMQQKDLEYLVSTCLTLNLF